MFSLLLLLLAASLLRNKLMVSSLRIAIKCHLLIPPPTASKYREGMF